jgi:hypothetical protein
VVAAESEDAILAEATVPGGGRRFYPRFEHPATARLRGQQERLEAFPPSTDRDKALDWTKEQIARFEHGEDQAKRDYLRAHRGR